MCRSIQTLFNYDPPTTDEEIYASSCNMYAKSVATGTHPN
jgi:hypothetical protein